MTLNTLMEYFASPPNQLINFCELLKKNNDLQSKVKKSTTAKEIIEIAASNGCEISYKELRIWSKELKAPYFPWAAKGSEWRRHFFL
jgi:hypothetical protein